VEIKVDFSHILKTTEEANAEWTAFTCNDNDAIVPLTTQLQKDSNRWL